MRHLELTVRNETMNWTLLTAILAALAFSPASLRADNDFSDVIIKTIAVSGNIHMLVGAGGNIAVSIGDDGVLIVDDQFKPLADKIQAAITELGGDTPKFLLNTHFHGDHVGGNEIFGKAATIVAHNNVRTRLMAKGYDKPSLPVVTFNDSLTIHFNNDEIKVIHMPPGHTDGDAVIWFVNANVVHLGDLFFSGMFPFVDIDAGGSVKTLIMTIEDILPKLSPDVKIIPGHGPLSTVSDLEIYLEMLKDTYGHLKTELEAGKSVDEIQQSGLSDKWKSWSWDFISEIRWIEIMITDIKKTSE